MHWINSLKENILVSLLAIFYVIANGILTFNEFYYLNFLPVIVLILYISFTRLDIIYFVIISFVPISIPLINYFPSLPIDFYIPTEPLIFGVMLIVLYKMAKGGFLDKKIISHPVTIVILINLFWIFFTAATSTMPLVSFKFLLMRIWFLVVFYLLSIYIFRQPNKLVSLMWCYTAPMLIVIIYSINRHLGYGLFDKDAAHFVMNPFFRDHTSYGAILAMIIFPFAAINLFQGQKFLRKFLVFIVFLLVLVALVLSYTRAAWISVFFSLGVLLVTHLKIKFKYLALASVLLIAVIYQNRVNYIHKMEKNDQESSANLTEHVQSISNIASDASNLERLNRWNSAFRMFKEKPVLGWGPGTYAFKYAPFQRSEEKTYISTNFGNMGNAHSEYIGPLAESGFLGTISFILIPIFTLITGFRIYRNLENKNLRMGILAVMLGLITYIIHGTLNNFLDTDKAASLYWGFTAFIVSIDIYQKDQLKKS